MTRVLYLTIFAMGMPASTAFAVQVPPPAKPQPPRVEVPRKVPPRAERPLRTERPFIDDAVRLRDLAPLDADFDLSSSALFDLKRSALDAELLARRAEVDARMQDFALRRGEALLSTRSGDVAPSVWKREPFMTSPRSAWLQGDVADSVYRAAYELLNRGEWRRSATAFASIPQRYPNSGYVADALYWQAFSLYRIGNTEDLQNALRSLETMRTKYPQAKTKSDAAALMTRIRGTLASRGDREAERALRDAMSEQPMQCDKEDQAVKSEALRALAQTDPASVITSVRRVLAKKDACSAPLRRTAVYLLGNSGDNDAPAILRDVALNDSEPEVRSTAIQYLARSPSDVAVNTLDEVLRTSTDPGVQRTAARALATNPNPRAKQAVRALIERGDAPERLRMEAVSGFENSERTTDEDAAYLRSVYGRVENPRIKARIARVIGQLGGDQNDQWLFGLMRNNDEPLEVRTAALSRIASNKMPIGDAIKLYSAVADRDMRQQLINVYGRRTEPEATDKLIDIVKNDTDYNLRRQAIGALQRKNDPRATKLLLELIDK